MRIITDLLKELDQWMENFNLTQYEEGRKVYVNQLKIRDILKEKKAVCFIQDGSIFQEIARANRRKCYAILCTGGNAGSP